MLIMVIIKVLLLLCLYSFAISAVATSTQSENMNCSTGIPQHNFCFTTCTYGNESHNSSIQCKEYQFNCSGASADNSSMSCLIGDAAISTYQQTCNHSFGFNCTNISFAEKFVRESCLQTVLCFSPEGSIRYTLSQLNKTFENYDITVCSTEPHGTSGNKTETTSLTEILQRAKNITSTEGAKKAIQAVKGSMTDSGPLSSEEAENVGKFLVNIKELLEDGKIKVSPATFEDIAGIASDVNSGYLQSINQNVALRKKLSRALPSIALHVQLNASTPSVAFSNSLADFNISLHLDPNVTPIESSSDNIRVFVPRTAVAKAWGGTSGKAKRRKRNEINEERKSAFLFYKDDSLFYSGQNVSSIVSADVGLNGGVSNLSDRVKIQHLNQLSTYGVSPIDNDTLKALKTTLLCVYWDYEQEDWLTEGCCLNLLSEKPECLCNHLTNFALIVKSENVPPDVALSTVSDVGCAISIVGLAATILIHFSSAELRNRRPAKILIQICINLFIANIIFVSGTTHALHSNEGCYMVAFFLHYFLLVTWCWMSVYTYDMHNSIVKVFSTAKSYYLRKMAGIAYGVPAIIACITVAIAVGYFDQRDANHLCGNVPDPNAVSAYVAENVCWLKSYSLYIGFLMPVGAMLCYNIFVFVIIFREIAFKTKVQSSAAKHTNSQRLVVAVTMATFMGLTWVFGFFVLASEDPLYITITSWIFAIFNVFQGLGIFILTTVRRAEMRKVWWTPLKSRLSKICYRAVSSLSRTKDQYPVTSARRNTTTTFTQMTTDFTNASEAPKKEYFVQVEVNVPDAKENNEAVQKEEQSVENSDGIKFTENSKNNEEATVREDKNVEARSWLYKRIRLASEPKMFNGQS